MIFGTCQIARMIRDLKVNSLVQAGDKSKRFWDSRNYWILANSEKETFLIRHHPTLFDWLIWSCFRILWVFVNRNFIKITSFNLTFHVRTTYEQQLKRKKRKTFNKQQTTNHELNSQWIHVRNSNYVCGSQSGRKQNDFRKKIKRFTSHSLQIKSNAFDAYNLFSSEWINCCQPTKTNAILYMRVRHHRTSKTNSKKFARRWRRFFRKCNL